MEAVEETGLTEKDAALSQGYDPRYWPRIKSGEKAAHLDRLSGLPERTQKSYVTKWARQLGMNVSDEDTRKRALADAVCAIANALREIG